MRRLSWLLLLVAAPAVASDKGLWFDFTPYPAARLLCTEVVLGTKGEHITWRTLASKSPPPAIVDFYEKAEHTQATAEDGAWHLAAEESPDRVKMTIYPAKLLERFPHCSEGTRKGERTVILISEML